MNRRDFFTLTVHFYPAAAKAGVQPFEPAGYPSDENPAYYRSHEFHFDKPPSRADFLKMCRQIPWTMTWKDDLFPLLQSEPTQWPMVDFMHKAASADIIDETGLKVGHLDVRRHDMYYAEGYDRTHIAVLVDNRDAVLRYVPEIRRHDAYMVLIREENRIQERLATYEIPLDSDVRREIRAVLVAHGFLGKGSRKKVTVDQAKVAEAEARRKKVNAPIKPL